MGRRKDRAGTADPVRPYSDAAEAASRRVGNTDNGNVDRSFAHDEAAAAHEPAAEKYGRTGRPEEAREHGRLAEAHRQAAAVDTASSEAWDASGRARRDKTARAHAEAANANAVAADRQRSLGNIQKAKLHEDQAEKHEALA